MVIANFTFFQVKCGNLIINKQIATVVPPSQRRISLISDIIVVAYVKLSLKELTIEKKIVMQSVSHRAQSK